MKIVIFGLSVSSSWGNGHATLWRGLIGALSRLGHRVTFFERDVPEHAAHRDVFDLAPARLRLYTEWPTICAQARREAAEADVAIVTSYCPDAIEATELVLSSRASIKCFYDLDAPITLARIASGMDVPYVGPDGFRGFDLVLSCTGGRALDEIKERLGASRVATLYGSVDPRTHSPVEARSDYAADLSYLGTYAADRQDALDRLLLTAARRAPKKRFRIGGAQYPSDFRWRDNIWWVPHVPPPDHPAFYCSSRITLNVTGAPMADMGWCPSGRLFEAAACGVPVLSDVWAGLDHFFTPGEEILIARTAADTLEALTLPDRELRKIAERARARTLAEHTAERRAEEMIGLLEGCPLRRSAEAAPPSSRLVPEASMAQP